MAVGSLSRFTLFSSLRCQQQQQQQGPRRGYHIDIGAREKALLEEDPALKRFKSYKNSVKRVSKVGDALTILVVAGVKGAAVSLGTKKTISKKKRLRSRQKKLKAYDLSALSEFLPDLDTSQQPIIAPGSKQNCAKFRQKLIKRESAKLRAVLNDPSFQTDPLAAIHQYLEKTQPPPAVSQEKRTRKKKNKDKRKLAEGSSSVAVPLDISTLH